ncbi:hypothetical protein [Acrocarpospora sp. B8E8]|uniref:hypothetical protein n=1 Tax=Acrocarpospora sp. B8E8 TaxID=3153572 RepID=UPI00325CDDD9
MDIPPWGRRAADIRLGGPADPDPPDAAVFDVDARYLDARNDTNTELARPFRQRPPQPGRVQPAITRKPERRQHIVHGKQRHAVIRRRRVQEIHVQAVCLGRPSLAEEFLVAFGGGREAKSTDPVPAGIQPGEITQFWVETSRVHDHAGLGDRGPQLADETR